MYERKGNEHPLIAPYTVYRASDDYIVVGVATDAQFVKFCTVLDLPIMERFKTNKQRCANSQDLHMIIEAAIGKHSVSHLSEAFKLQGIPFSTINSIKTMFEDEVIKEMKLTETTESGLEFPRFPL